VLGEFVLPSGGSAWTSAFLNVFTRLGIEEKAGRQALARTAADGWISAAREGRRAQWSLTPAGRRLLTEGTERIYAFAGSQRDWDGRWLLVLARVPESDRAARHLLRTRLGWAGLGSPAPGIWITTHAERQEEISAVLTLAGVEDGQVFVARHGAGELGSLIRQAWDLAGIEREYESFIAAFGSSSGSASASASGSASASASASEGDPLIRVIELVHAWRRFPAVDPGLPRGLLPALWSGERAAQLFADRHAAWSAAAVASWVSL
jgi:phenylacetic acid degradation operon negative regulatory protein